MRIGAVEGGGPEMFSNIRDFEANNLGEVFVLDFVSQEIRVFDSTGAFRRAFGRNGEGPGEFQRANGLSWGPDGLLWVNDPGNHRLSAFSRDGEVKQSRPRFVSGRQFNWPGGIDGEGRLYDTTPLVSGSFSNETGPEPVPPYGLIRFTPGTGLVDTLPIPSVGSFFYRIPMGALPIPFLGEDQQAFDPGGFLWVGNTGEYRITKITLLGDTLATLTGPSDPSPVTRAERDSAVAALESWMRERGPVAELDYSLIPRKKPAFVHFFPDDVGRLWVQLAGVGEGTSFDVFGTTGIHLATVRIPHELQRYPRPRVVGDRMLGVLEDELGVQFIWVGRINP